MSISIFNPPELSSSVTSSPYQTPEKRLSAGRAWFLSMLLPGLGQFYCGANTRAGAMTILSILAIGVSFLLHGAAEIALRLLVMFYTLAPLDAYFTARENNAGIDIEAPNNPRVAALLNLTTNGFGYLYINVREFFGVAFFLGIAGKFIRAKWPLAVELFLVVIAIHAWKLAARKREEEYPAAMRPDVEETSLPQGVPIAVAAIIIGHYWLLVILGQFVMISSGTAD